MACKRIKRDTFKACLRDMVRLDFIERKNYNGLGKPRVIEEVVKSVGGVPKTVSRIGLSQINGVATNSRIDTVFYVKYGDLLNIDQAKVKYVKYNNFIYAIESYENKDLKNEWWTVYARSRGDDSKEASKI
jgi:hypothetical protein